LRLRQLPGMRHQRSLMRRMQNRIIRISATRVRCVRNPLATAPGGSGRINGIDFRHGRLARTHLGTRAPPACCGVSETVV
jgi:hypothetical protein